MHLFHFADLELSLPSPKAIVHEMFVMFNSIILDKIYHGFVSVTNVFISISN